MPRRRSARRTCARRRTARSRSAGRRPRARAAPAAPARSSAARPASARTRRASPRSFAAVACRVVALGDARPACGPSRPAPRTRCPRRRPASGPGASRSSPTSPSRYFSNSQASRLLPMPAWPVIETSRARRSRVGGVEELLEQRAAPRRGPRTAPRGPPRGRGPPRSATTRSARQAGTGRGLALAAPARPPARRRWPRRRRARSPRRPGRCPASAHRLQPAGGVDQVAGDHPLAAARRWSPPPRRSAPPRARRERLRPAAEAGHRGDELERGAHRPLGVVLVRHRARPRRPSPRRR